MKLLFILVFIFPFSAWAYFISAGTYVPYFNKVQVSNTGETQKFRINPYFGIGTQLLLSGPNFFTPEFGYTYFLENAKNTRRDQIYLHYNFSYTLNSNFVLRYGLTNNWYRLHGLGGSVTLDNGNSKTTFPSPDKTVVTYFSTLNVGGEFIFTNRQYSLRFDFQTMSFKKLENRSYNYLLTFNFYK